MPTFVFKKLVRDSILGVLEKERFQNIRYHQLGSDEHLIALKDKLLEESKRLERQTQNRTRKVRLGAYLKSWILLLRKQACSWSTLRKKDNKSPIKRVAFVKVSMSQVAVCLRATRTS